MKASTTILQNQIIAPNLLHLIIEKPANFDFVAGQFVRFSIPNGDKMALRSYSIASTPSEPFLHFFIRLYENGLGSGFISKLSINDRLDWDGPYGLFTNKIDRPIFFVATGAGLAPCFSILKNELLDKNNTNEMKLLIGLRYEEDPYAIEELDFLQNKFPNFLYQIVLSKGTEAWKGLRGHVTEFLPTNAKHLNFYLCGNPNMIKEARTILINRALPANQIHQEIF